MKTRCPGPRSERYGIPGEPHTTEKPFKGTRCPDCRRTYDLSHNPIRNGPIYKEQYAFRVEHGGPIAEVKAAYLQEKGKPWLTPLQIAEQTQLIDPLMGSSPSIWAAWDAMKAKYPRPKNEINAPSAEHQQKAQHVRSEAKSLAEEDKPDFPWHVVQAEADRIGRIDPVTGLPEGTILRLKDKPVLRRIELRGDHIVPRAKGGKTVPSNLQIISTIANNFKLASETLTPTDLAKRIWDAGYQVAQLTPTQLEVLNEFRVIR